MESTMSQLDSKMYQSTLRWWAISLNYLLVTLVLNHGDARSLSCTDVDGINMNSLDSRAPTYCVSLKEQKRSRRNYKLASCPLYLTCIAGEEIFRSPTSFDSRAPSHFQPWISTYVSLSVLSSLYWWHSVSAWEMGQSTTHSWTRGLRSIDMHIA